jgi:nitroimidazol reductase NimA-like FMN-containing flavoprotein (pyridoxamine 5'-phosphate oxidase superfamily)
MGLRLKLTVTVNRHMDGLVLSLTPFHNSCNYRSSIIYGYATLVTDPEEALYASTYTLYPPYPRSKVLSYGISDLSAVLTFRVTYSGENHRQHAAPTLGQKPRPTNLC